MSSGVRSFAAQILQRFKWLRQAGLEGDRRDDLLKRNDGRQPGVHAACIHGNARPQSLYEVMHAMAHAEASIVARARTASAHHQHFSMACRETPRAKANSPPCKNIQHATLDIATISTMLMLRHAAAQNTACAMPIIRHLVNKSTCHHRQDRRPVAGGVGRKAQNAPPPETRRQKAERMHGGDSRYGLSAIAQHSAAMARRDGHARAWLSIVSDHHQRFNTQPLEGAEHRRHESGAGAGAAIIVQQKRGAQSARKQPALAAVNADLVLTAVELTRA